MAKNKDLKGILLEELENKKSFTANWQTECSVGGEDIEEGDTFYFMGEKKKVCQNCFAELQEEVERL